MPQYNEHVQKGWIVTHANYKIDKLTKVVENFKKAIILIKRISTKIFLLKRPKKQVADFFLVEWDRGLI